MAKIKLQTKCSDILEQLYARAEQQLRCAHAGAVPCKARPVAKQT